jgi:hypothetical protein
LLGTPQAQDKKTWQEVDLAKLKGHWTSVREEEDDNGVTRVDVTFTDGRLAVSVFRKNSIRPWADSITTMGVERAEDMIRSPSRLKFDRRGAEVYYDFVGEKLILVGRIWHRPFAGFRLSGEYKRVENPKAPKESP